MPKLKAYQQLDRLLLIGFDCEDRGEAQETGRWIEGEPVEVRQ